MTTPRKPAVAIIGDGSLDPESALIATAEAMGLAVVDNRWRLVCGGRGGVMLAAARGAHRSAHHGPDSVIGVLPHGDADGANRYVDVPIPTPLGHLRNAIVAHADAIVAIGGGAGTLSELAFAWMADRPIVAFRVEGWSGRLADQRIDGRKRPVDFGRPDEVWGVDEVDQAVEILQAIL